MLNCRDATQLFSESQERTLTSREKMALRIHVAMCSGCRHCKRHMDILRAAARAYAKGADQNRG